MVFAEGSTSKPNEYLNRLEVDGEDGSEFIDQWDTGDLLFLASSVLRSDRNWVSVSRSIKPFGEQSRPSEWYTPKNCALQYTKLLGEIEEDSKKKTLPRTERETSEVMLVKNLTEKRLSELAWLSQQTKASANVLKTYMDMVENGDFDEHLDDLLNKIEESEKLEEENYNQYVSKRDNLFHTKKLNKSRIIKGKAVTKVLDPKKKIQLFPDLSDDSRQSPLKEVKKEAISDDECSKSATIKQEVHAPITLNALLDTKVTTPSESPLLTSLLRSIASTTSVSQTVSSPLKEVKVESQSQQAAPEQKIDVFLSPTKLSCAGISPLLTSLLKSAALPLPALNTSLATKESDLLDDSSKSDMEKSREASPRSSVPPSPRASSSPMLNSLLKNSPSSTTSIQMSPVKEISPKAVSSPQSFFNPTSALATAAAQQLAVATSTSLPPGLQFFQQHDLLDRKIPLRTSPVTSACLSAPTLSKLLEMPPSSPGKLPPLPILDPPITPTPPSTPSEPTTPKQQQYTSTQLTPKQPVAESPSKKNTELPFFPDSTVLLKSPASYSLADRKAIASDDAKTVAVVEEKVKPRTILDVSQKDSSVILEEITESFNQAFEVILPATTEIKTEILEEFEVSNAELDIDETTESVIIDTPVTIKEEILSPSGVEELDISDSAINELLFQDVTDQKVFSTIDILTNPDPVSAIEPSIQETLAVRDTDVFEDDRGVNSRKFYKSRVPGKKDEILEKAISDTPVLQSPKKTVFVKVEPDSSLLATASEDITVPVDVVVTESIAEKVQDSKSTKSNEARSPVSKKPRLHERSSTEKTELSEDDMPIRRSGRRGKKGRGRAPKSAPVKQSDPKDQYEFSDNTEENSVGYQATNTLCYMPRSKEETRLEDLKLKSLAAQDSEDAPSTASSPTEKKLLTPTRSKQGKTPAPTVSARKSLFTSDSEERMSDSVASDDASNHLLSEDKLKKWEETCEKKGDIAKIANESLRRIAKTIESPKKKSIAGKRNSSGKSAPGRKERKLSGLDMEELSAGSRDSEELSTTQEKEIPEEKVVVPSVSVDMEIETNDSHPSSTAAESDKQTEDNDESLQGSVMTDFSPPATAEIKDDKDAPHFGKQDWFQVVSPKSSEAVSQSSEESEEYESDNWDNQSVSTNKSASQSTGMQPRSKRKERETPEYKAWKKAISIVLREASCHKNANVFLQKVTNDVAPGYLSIVHKPMDLSLIKKNIDNGVVRTTEEFHRDMLIMFQNAIMYNSSDHDVYQMAVEMQQDVLEQISAFVLTQSNGKDEVSEPVSSLRGTRKSQKGKQSSSTKGKEDTEKE